MLRRLSLPAWASSRLLSTRAKTYRVAITTGEVRGAGTTEPAWLQLKGEKGETDVQQLDGNFERGSTEFFDIGDEEIGALHEVILEHNNRIASGSAWFVAELTVRHLDSGHSWRFPLNKWLGGADSASDPSFLAGRVAEVLTPNSADAITETSTTPLSLSMSTWCVPHMRKVRDGKRAQIGRWLGTAGEDAYFIFSSCEEGLAKEVAESEMEAFGYADGVGQWRKRGIDPGIFSARLMALCREAYVHGAQRLPERALRHAWENLVEEKVLGSCTAGVVALDRRERLLTAVNIGDSGFIVLRDGEVIHRTRQQEHRFGCPFQLGIESKSTVDDGDRYTARVQEGDVVVAGSDGLFDNMFEWEIAGALERHSQAGKPFHAFAQSLVRQAYDHSLSPYKETPFSNAASDAMRRPFSGGNQDDITAIAALVVPA